MLTMYVEPFQRVFDDVCESDLTFLDIFWIYLHLSFTIFCADFQD